jgi:hypothetical protein
MRSVRSLSGLAGPGASLKDAGGGGVTVLAPEPDNASLAHNASVTNAGDGFCFSADGLYLYYISSSNYVSRRTLTVAHDLSSATTTAAESFGSYDVRGVAISPDGTSFYIGDEASDIIRQYTLSTPYDLSTKTQVASKSVSSQDASPRGIHMSPDGTKFYMQGLQADSTFEYTLTTPWLISSAVYVTSLSHAAYSLNRVSVSLTDDGLNLYAVGSSGYVLWFVLSTPWSLATATYTETTVSLFNIGATGFDAIFAHPLGYGFFIGSNNDLLTFCTKAVLIGDETYYGKSF